MYIDNDFYADRNYSCGDICRACHFSSTFSISFRSRPFPFSFEINERIHGSTSVNFTSWARERDSFYEIIFRPKGEEERGCVVPLRCMANLRIITKW